MIYREYILNKKPKRTVTNANKPNKKISSKKLELEDDVNSLKEI